MLTVVFFSLSLVAEEHKHEHKAPHNGTLIVLGDEFAHLELVLQKDGKLTGYVLGGEPDTSVRIKQEEIQLKLSVPKEEGKSDVKELKVTLKAVANILTGEKKGDSSQFETEVEGLKAIKIFEGVIVSITIKGKEFKDIKFKFPEGNESR